MKQLDTIFQAEMAYYSMIHDPSFILDNFKTEQEFDDWLSLGTLEDIECTRKHLIRVELYEYIPWLDKHVEGRKR